MGRLLRLRHKETFSTINTIRNNFDLGLHQIVPMTQFQLGLGLTLTSITTATTSVLAPAMKTSTGGTRTRWLATPLTMTKFERYAETLACRGSPSMYDWIFTE